MKPRLLPALAAVLTVIGGTGCDLLEGFRQTCPGNSGPVFLSTPWKAERAERRAAAAQNKEAARALKLLTTPTP